MRDIICALPHTAAKPIIVAIDDCKIFYAKMVAFLSGVLEDGRFILATEASCGRKMLVYSRG